MKTLEVLHGKDHRPQVTPRYDPSIPQPVVRYVPRAS
jgi:hypothetical protein